MNVYCLYFPDGKRYVGVESKTGKRIETHRHSKIGKGPAQAVTKEIVKWGWPNLKWRYLATNCTRREALRLEAFFIRDMSLQDRSVGHNISGGHRLLPEKPGYTKVSYFMPDRDFDLLSRNLPEGVTLDDVCKDAFSLYSWARKEVAQNRNISSCGKDNFKNTFLCWSFFCTPLAKRDA